MLIWHLLESTFVYHQVSICKPHLTWSFLCPLICPNILLNFIPVTHLFSWSHSFDSPRVYHSLRETHRWKNGIHIYHLVIFAIPLSHPCFFPVRLSCEDTVAVSSAIRWQRRRQQRRRWRQWRQRQSRHSDSGRRWRQRWQQRWPGAQKTIN